MKSKSEKLIKKIKVLKEQLVVLGAMHPGSLSKQIRKKNGEPYGEYWHLSYTFAGKGHTKYIPTARVEEFTLMVKNFQKFKLLSDQIIALSIELDTLESGGS